MWIVDLIFFSTAQKAEMLVCDHGNAGVCSQNAQKLELVLMLHL